ncbi:MAG TPA: HEAT repeat domain-containing protein [Waterburya sp.]
MLDLVALVTGFAFASILKEIAKDAAKDWVKDFFKGLPTKTSQYALKIILPSAHKKAIKAFLLLVQKELEADGLDRKQVKQYRKPLSQFLKNKSVREILGSAFQKNCKTIDSAALGKIWQESQLKALPDNFNWELVAIPYCREVTKIRRDSAELREILDSETLDTIASTSQATAQNTAAAAQALQTIAGIIPKFDLEQYRESLGECYGYLKLNVLDSTDHQYRLRLWKMFIPQMVREALPPSRYDLPKEIQQRLRDAGHLEGDFSLEDLERYRESYFQKPVRSVLDVLKDAGYPYMVILGDPGSGKSTLLQYLALQWAEEPTEQLPLLVELREYIRDRATPASVLEFFHRGTRTIQKLNQADLDRQLRSGRALVLFDGLDEVFDPVRREEVITEIIRFTNEYKNVRVVVTSRIVGYNPERLRDAEFRHLTLQDLEPKQIQEFIETWHDLALGNDPDREMLQKRLQDAIDNSKSIAELAGNPLLLTMMAILNRRQELPRDRAELYDQASRVLLYNWDVDYKRLQVSAEAIGRPEKQSLLRQIAYEMQAGEKGIKGNIINGEKLLEIITKFLKEREFDQPRQKAQILINQLRERNFILCYLGNDYYGFVHRTFLEYFCASEFCVRFGKRGLKGGLTIDGLKTEVFGKHWQDESWHEVLRLICGMVGMVEEQVAGLMIEHLMEQKDESKPSINLVLAAECLSEVRNRSSIKLTSEKLLNHLQELTKQRLDYTSYGEVIGAIAQNWKDDPKTLLWLQSRVQEDNESLIQILAIVTIARTYKDNPQTLAWLQSLTQEDNDVWVTTVTVTALAQYYKDDPSTLPLLKSQLQNDEHENVRSTAVKALAQYYKDDLNTLPLLKSYLQKDEHENVRSAAVEALAEHYKDNPNTLLLLQSRFQEEESKRVRRIAVRVFARNYTDAPQTLPWLKSRLHNDEHEDVRSAAVEALAQYYKDDPDTLPLLKSQLQNDEHENVRSAAVEALAEHYKDDPNTLLLLQSRLQEEESKRVRRIAVRVFARNYTDAPQTLPWLKSLKSRLQEDEHEDVRSAAVYALAEHYKEDPDTPNLLKSRLQEDEHEDVRSVAVYALAQYYKDDPDTLPLLKSQLQKDEHENVRSAAVETLAEHYKDDPETLALLQSCVQSDESWEVRRAVVRALGKNLSHEPGMFEFLYNCAINDPFERENEWQDNPRKTALKAILKHHRDNPRTLDLLRDRAENDPEEKLREFAKRRLQRSC